MVVEYRKPKYTTLNDRRYKITGYTEGAKRLAVAEYRAKTKTKDYGWRPVKNLSIQVQLYNKISKR